MKEQPEDQQASPEQQRKQPYETPRLTKHGSVEDITTKVGLSAADGMTGSGIA